MKRLFRIGVALAALGMMCAAVPAAAQEKIVVWWVKGFYPSEDAALYEAIKKFEAKTGVKVELSQYAVQDGIPKTVAALDAGTPPDVAYIDVYDFQVLGKWAFEGKLEDLTDVLVPLKNTFLPNTLETVYLYNDKTKKKAYYGFPLKQQTMHTFYWKDMLAEAGDTNIPETWKEYWAFWCEKAQPDHRKKTGKRTFGTGFPMGVDSSDSFYSFLTFADAYNVKLVDEDGKVLVSDPKVRAGLINALRDYTSPYIKGCTPPSSTSWKDPDNNVAFHNKTTIMTHNATISIPAQWYDNMNNDKLPPAEREQAKKNYNENIATAGFPRKPDGSPMTYRAAVKTGAMFADSKNKKRGKEFIAFLLLDENLIPYVEGSLGRWYPVTKSGAARLSFWLADPHRTSVQRQFSAGTSTFEFTKNWKFTILNNENVWAKAMNRVVSEKWSVEKAADELIARIKEVAG
jgi:multiple sugar transport system substrate-binding protein